MTARSQRAATLLVGGLMAFGFTMIAAVQVAAWTIGATERTTHQVVPGPIRMLEVDAGAADIVIVPTAGDDVRIDSSAKGRLHTPRIRAVKDGMKVRLQGSCPSFSVGPCHASVVMHVPPSVTVDVRSDSGDLTASGLSGTVSLRTGSGDVNAEGLTGSADLQTQSGDVNARAINGPLALRTASGDVNGEDLAAAGVEAATASGDVELDFRVAPRDVEASTASGDVDVSVPPGDTYRVESDTGSGESTIGVKTDPNATRVIRARTNSGDALVGYGN